MSILITGGAGYIGSHTAVELLNQNQDVIIIDNLNNASETVLERIRQITGKTPKFYNMDLRDSAALDQVFSQNKIKAVIHFAGAKAPGESMTNPLKYYNVNIGSAVSLMEAMAKAGVKNLVFSSSAAVYGLINQPPMTEDMPLFALNPYGTTKIVQEQMMKEVYASDNSWNILMLRYFNPVGAHESGLIGENPAGVPQNIAPSITQVLVGKQPILNLYGNDYNTPDGTCIRDYIHITDLALGHIAAVNALAKNPGIDAINLGTGKGSSVLEVIAAFELASGKEVPKKWMPRRGGDADSSYADVSKATRLLNWRAEKTLNDMCRDAWNWQSKNPNGYAKS